MSGSNVEETSEQTRGRETEPTARGRDKKDKSRDAVANMEARLAKVELAMADTREGFNPVSHEEFVSFQGKVLSMLASMESRIEALATRIESRDQEEASRVEMPKPHRFSGNQDAKELDNFLWHMERYFEAIALTDEAAKVRTETLYLTDTATLMVASEVCRYGERHLHHRDVGGLQEGDQEAVLPRGRGLPS
ncbi:hypothetical protein CK203_059966 [Vitis vinifera]|uniref:Uncharacterized protein n=1 Tax=Vitis vinifera TaxID=29760 RepID=A0A438GGM1_VITVI|nr:hypothetical protein CK203_059966 [Vitis vinifera]